MRKFITKAAALAAAVIMVSSCFLDDTLQYNVMEICTVDNASRLLTDEGITFNIVENNISYQLKAGVRVLATCDVLKPTDNKTGEYDIRLKECSGVDIVEILSSEKPESFGADGINLYDGWMRNGYINVQYHYTKVSESKTVHDINLVYDELRSNADTAKFYLVHNEHGDGFSNENVKLSDCVVVSGLVSYPVENFVPKDSRRFVELNWKWFEAGTNGILTKTLEEHKGYLRNKEQTN